ncbi:MAG: hypothetical protein KF708_06335 [Pirellulales bacterium]|nr:hypothetical protein [Pirellulales bacterium]
MAPPPRVLLLGPAEHAEFDAAVALLAATSTLQRAADVPAALAAYETDDAPVDLIVVAQPHSGALRGGDLEPLLARAPLARVLVLAGSWCEGEMRSGLPIAGATRILWHQWTARWQQELARWQQNTCPAWSLPMTATEDDRLLQAADEPLAKLEGRATIVATDATAGWLADVCRGLGLATETLAPRAGFAAMRPACDLVIFEVEALRCDAPESAWNWARAWQGVPLIGVGSFPRLEDRAAWTDAGVQVLLAQPLLIDDLRWHIVARLRPGLPQEPVADRS